MTVSNPEHSNNAFKGMSKEDLDACEYILGELSETLGFDAKSAFERMRRGESLTQALGLPAQTSDAMYAQAISQFNAGNTNVALQLFRALTVLAPNTRDHWLGLGICARIKDQSDLARIALQTATSLSPDTPAPLFHLCELFCHMSEWANAGEYLIKFDACEESSEKQKLKAEMQRLRTLIEMRKNG